MSFESFYQSGQVTYLIIAVMVVEIIYFARDFKRNARLLAGLAAGVCLVLALRAALLQQSWTMVAFFVLLSFGFHILELLQWLRPQK